MFFSMPPFGFAIPLPAENSPRSLEVSPLAELRAKASAFWILHFGVPIPHPHPAIHNPQLAGAPYFSILMTRAIPHIWAKETESR